MTECVHIVSMPLLLPVGLPSASQNIHPVVEVTVMFLPVVEPCSGGFCYLFVTILIYFVYWSYLVLCTTRQPLAQAEF